MEVRRDRAEAAAAAAFRKRGINKHDAALTAEVLVSADACGKHSHGLFRLSRFIQGIDHGNVHPDGDIDIADTARGVSLVDGGARLGPVVADVALEEATRLAARNGVGIAGVHNGNHLGMLGYYTGEASQAGYVAIALTNTEPAMAPHGGAEPVLGTNPVAIGLPTDPPFNLDMSTSSISRGEILEARERGEQLPDGVALDSDGNPTTEPDSAIDGVIRPIGGPKGSGLAIAVEVFAGGLVGAAMGRDVTGTYQTEQRCTKGDLFLVLDPAAFADGFVSKTETFLASLKETQPVAGSDAVRLPGERSVERIRSATQITVDDGVWEDVRRLAGDVSST